MGRILFRISISRTRFRKISLTVRKIEEMPKTIMDSFEIDDKKFQVVQKLTKCRIFEIVAWSFGNKFVNSLFIFSKIIKKKGKKNDLNLAINIIINIAAEFQSDLSNRFGKIEHTVLKNKILRKPYSKFRKCILLVIK